MPAGNLTRMARILIDAMIATIDSPSPPLRLAPDKSAYESIRASLSKQREMLEAQKGIALPVMEDA